MLVGAVVVDEGRGDGDSTRLSPDLDEVEADENVYVLGVHGMGGSLLVADVQQWLESNSQLETPSTKYDMDKQINLKGLMVVFG